MLFNSAHFLIFFPIILLGYYIIPQKVRYIWLLVASYYFYMSWNPRYVVLILTSTIITYGSGILISTISNRNRKKLVMICCLIANLGILFYFKYINFSIRLVEAIAAFLHIQLQIPTVDVLLPVGISFYTFQALSYTIDVYREDILPEKNFLRYALFVSFFPQLVAGPIERSKNLLSQLNDLQNKFDYAKFREGILLMLWGYFLKLVLADRIAIFVDSVYGNYTYFNGAYIIFASVLFAFQIYCDFYGYSVIAMGAAHMLGIELMENFRAPYLSENVAQFWRGWHISLTTWFKDYVYIPLGGNRKGKIRKALNKIIVFLLSGLWHGADLSFVVWGGMNGLYQVIGELLMPIRDKIVAACKLDRLSLSHKLVNVIVTFILVDFSWIFFRAKNITEAIKIIKNMFIVHNPWIFIDGSIYECGLDAKNFWLMIICILVLIFADYQKKKGIIIRDILINQEAWFRCVAIAFSIWFIVLFGIWGTGYDAASFIYFQF